MAALGAGWVWDWLHSITVVRMRHTDDCAVLLWPYAVVRRRKRGWLMVVGAKLCGFSYSCEIHEMGQH